MKANMEGYCKDEIKMHLAVVPSSRHIETIEIQEGISVHGSIVAFTVLHRVVGYLEEKAIHSYIEYLKDIDSGVIENVCAPATAIDYLRLPKNANLKDVITVIRGDEGHHCDVNHFASDLHFQGRQLKEAPAPVGYH
uniref:Ubiquinol oxidase n=1 Tax=Chenopodium quinoa TaxID=63459 RepID=A0A803N118_CHEQI